MSGAALMIQAYSAPFRSSKSDLRVMPAGANMVGCQEFADELRERIERRYREGGYGLGWRLLYSPAGVLEGARVAFIGINPGREKPYDHAEFAMASGSAFVEERWKNRQLQKQARTLFEMLGERPEDVLAGNLVPFYTPRRWTKLPNDEKKKAAVAFGQKLWCDMIHRARPSLVIVHGIDPTFKKLREELGGTEPKKCVLGRGASGRRTLGRRCTWPGGTLVGLPHLSHFNSRLITSRPGAVRCLLGLAGEKEGLHPAPSQQRSQKSHGTFR